MAASRTTGGAIAAKRIRGVCSFITGVAEGVRFRVEELRGSHPANSCNIQTKLVEAKLEMVCAAGVFHSGAAVPGVCWFITRGRFQRDEIDRRLQGSIGPRQGGSRCN